MDSFIGLLNNAAMMLILCVIYDTFGLYAIANQKLRYLCTGVVVGLIGIAVMLNPWSIQPGVFFDTRWVLLSLCGLFFGFFPTLVAVIITGSFRLYQGGTGGTVGTIVIVVTACVGLAWKYRQEKLDKPLGWKDLYAFGVLVQLAMLSCMFLMPVGMRIPIIKAVAPPILIIYPFLTMVIGLILRRQEVRRTTDKELQENRKALSRERGLLRGVINSIPDLIFFKNTEGAYLGCNKSFEAFAGTEEQDLLGKTAFDLFDPDMAAYCTVKDNETLLGGKSVNTDEWVNYPDGKKVLLDTVKTPFQDLDGTLHGLVGISRDITDRKKAEKEVLKAKEEWALTFAAMPDIVTIQDKEMRIVQANQAAHQFFQAKDGELNGKYCYELFTGTPDPCAHCPLLTTLQDIGNHSEIIKHAKLAKTFQVSSSAIPEENGDIRYLVHVARDITEHIKLEADLFQAHKMEAIGTLAGGIAHDFNNILTAIMGYSELVKLSVPDDSDAGKDIVEVLNAGKRATELVRQILSFSRKTEHDLQLLMPHMIVKEALKMLRSSLPTTLSLKETIDPDCGTMLADPTQIHQIVVNLCTNAFHAMENEKGTLAVNLCRKDIRAEDISESDVSPGPFIVLSVSDTGHGMDQETVLRVFDPYFTTKEVGKGTGLGLAVIHGIVKDYKGFIQVESTPGKGSSFHVHFPALEKVAATPEKTDEEPLPTGSERILIVDDESSIVNLYKAILDRLDYTVTATTKSQDALEKIRLHPDQFDLLITDQTMPDLSGVELAQEVLKIKPTMPIILCTGYSSVITEESALAIGIRKYAKKPVNRPTLAKIVRQALENY